MPKPKIVTANQLRLSFANRFGQLGPELYVTGHHTAGPRDRNDSHCVDLIRAYHRAHAAQGWGGIGYHYCISRRGTLYCLRPTILKGAHVGGHNSSNVGVMCHGTTGHRPTIAQARTFLWLLRNAHTDAMPRAHRTDRSLRGAPRRGHNDWSGHRSNACPGTHKRMYLDPRPLLRGSRGSVRGLIEEPPVRMPTDEELAAELVGSGADTEGA